MHIARHLTRVIYIVIMCELLGVQLKIRTLLFSLRNAFGVHKKQHDVVALGMHVEQLKYGTVQGCLLTSGGTEAEGVSPGDGRAAESGNSPSCCP